MKQLEGTNRAARDVLSLVEVGSEIFRLKISKIFAENGAV